MLIAKIERTNKEAKEKLEYEIELKHKYTVNREMDLLVSKCKRKKERIRRLRSITTTFEVRRLISKWKLVTTMARYAEQLKRNVLDDETLKDFLVRDMKKIFFADDLVRLTNSIAVYKERIKESDEKFKEMAYENFELRKRCNQLQLEKDDQIAQFDNLSALLSNQEYSAEMVNIERLNAIEERKTVEKKLSEVLNQLKFAANRVEELEEKYGLKPSETTKKKLSAKKEKMQQTKKLVESYQEEMKSLELRLYGRMQLEKRAILTGSDG